MGRCLLSFSLSLCPCLLLQPCGGSRLWPDLGGLRRGRRISYYGWILISFTTFLYYFIMIWQRRASQLPHYKNKNHKNLNSLKTMTTIITNVNLDLVSEVKLSGYKNRVIASAVALLAVYAINFIFQALITFFRTENKAPVMRKLMETSQVLYWFGVASMFSIYPPFYYGAFNAIIGYITFVVVLLMHIFCLTDKTVSERSLWSITYFLYHFLVMVWLVVGLILAYIWSNLAYKTS